MDGRTFGSPLWDRFRCLLLVVVTASLAGCTGTPFASSGVAVAIPVETPVHTPDGAITQTSATVSYSANHDVPLDPPDLPMSMDDCTAHEPRAQPEAPGLPPPAAPGAPAAIPSPSATRPASVLTVSEATFDQQVLRSPVPVLVDFHATWCGPCKVTAPTLDQLAVENPQARIVKVDIDENPHLAAYYRVDSVPSLLAQQRGVASKARLTAMLDLRPAAARR